MCSFQLSVITLASHKGHKTLFYKDVVLDQSERTYLYNHLSNYTEYNYYVECSVVEALFTQCNFISGNHLIKAAIRQWNLINNYSRKSKTLFTFCHVSRTKQGNLKFW